MFYSNSAEIQRAQILLGNSEAHADRRIDGAGVVGESIWSNMTALKNLFIFAGLTPAQQRKYILLTSIAVVAVIMLVLLVGRFVFLSLVFLPPLYALLALKRKVRQRAEAFEKDYTAFILALASSVRTGLDPLVALTEERNLFPEQSEIHQQLSTLQGQIDRGFSEEDVIRNFALSIQHSDLPLFRTAFILARKEGASLAECLQRLARVTRQRQSFRRKVKGAVAMQKLSSFGIAGCTIVIGIIQFTTNPDALAAALEHPMGMKLLAGGVGLVVFGLLWMLQLAKSKV